MLVKDYGEGAEYTNSKGETVLMKSAANGHWDVCKFLLQEGAKVNAHDVEYVPY